MKKQGSNLFIRIAAALMSTLLVATAVPAVDAKAASTNVDMSRTGTLEINHRTADNEAVKGVVSKVYRVASIDENGYYKTVAPFDSETAFPIQDINSIKTQKEWDSCLEPAKEYVKDNNISPDASSKSDGSGKTVYSGLSLGIYLVTCDSVKIGNFKHYFSDFFVAVPGLETVGEDSYKYVYDVVASPKHSKEDVTVINEYAVYKRWNDTGYSSNRPSSVTVQIYCDGNLYETVTLSANNSWHYKWKYEAGHEWRVRETSTGRNYSPAVTTEGNGFVFVITNTYNPPEVPDTPPNDPGETPGTPDLPEVLGAIRDLPAVLGARRLPQTGQLWWPLPILVLLGLFFIVKGIRQNAHSGI